MFDVGRICVKVAGRDAGKQCVIVEAYGDGNVLVDGQTRRRKCNIRHLEPTDKTVDLKSGATHDQVKAAFSKLSIDVRDTKPKQAGAKPVRQKAKKEAPVKEKKAKKETKAEPVVEAPEGEAPAAPAKEDAPAAEKKEE